MKNKLKIRLKELRLKRNLTQKELATKLEISVHAYSNYERGKSIPRFKNLYLLAIILNSTSNYLLGIDDFNKKDL